jgi:hypothetical protein
MVGEIAQAKRNVRGRPQASSEIEARIIEMAAEREYTVRELAGVLENQRSMQGKSEFPDPRCLKRMSIAAWGGKDVQAYVSIRYSWQQGGISRMPA